MNAPPHLSYFLDALLDVGMKLQVRVTFSSPYQYTK